MDPPVIPANRLGEMIESWSLPMGLANDESVLMRRGELGIWIFRGAR
jgi:hypothetical protein